MKRHGLTLAALLVAAACLWLARAPLPADDKKASSDKEFMMEAAQGGLLEVKLGQVAREQGSSDAVRKFGERMVTEHSKANKQLTALATKKGVSLPPSLDNKHQGMLDQLAKLKGEEFDRSYANHMVRDHEHDIAEFESEAKKGQDADVKAWAAQTLPTLREHLALAKKLQGK
jgi:putative membrane protein